MIISVTLGNVQEDKIQKVEQNFNPGSALRVKFLPENNWVMKQGKNDPKQGHQSKNNSRRQPQLFRRWIALSTGKPIALSLG